MVYRYVWKNNEKRRMLYGRHCRVLARGTMNSALVEFVDTGQRECISRNALRRVAGEEGWGDDGDDTARRRPDAAVRDAGGEAAGL
uniref:Uncharacterized protein n=1 Tax=viral metagenome TaxID=1070528 RepID=A0A6M3XH07_9ZZZZ